MATRGAVRCHQALRIFADGEAGYGDPKMYIRFFRVDYEPHEYIGKDSELGRKHRDQDRPL
ncbi:MAG: hypothetical protein IH939_08695 [Acidobacteria bacterium]|nr:hypothetical protein [Acidobacteriota bacterium]